MSKKVLVTGASGFIASHTIIDLLKHGYEVKGTLRDASRGGHLKSVLSKHYPEAANIELVSASLTDRDSWNHAVENCQGVIHIASPVPLIQPKDPQEVIEPARQGTLNVLQAASAAGIHRVVLTSSVAAVFGSNKQSNKTYTARDWSDPHDKKLSAYAISKTVAEKVAWDFAAEHSIDLTAVNPGLVLGPALEADYGSSLEALYKLLTGEVPLLPRLGFEVVDVRDVAALHRLAFENIDAIGQRLLCGAGFRWMVEIAETLKETYPENRKIPSRQMPNFMARFAAIFVKEIEGFLNDLDVVKKLDCSAAIALGWTPRSPEDAIREGAQSLIDTGVVA